MKKAQLTTVINGETYTLTGYYNKAKNRIENMKKRSLFCSINPGDKLIILN